MRWKAPKREADLAVPCPTKITHHRHGTIRYVEFATGRKVVRGGRESFLWLYYVLLPLAAESTTAVEWRCGRGTAWHEITASVEEAEAALEEFGGRTGRILVRKARNAREARQR
jgi:hypothetical protein